MTVRIAVLVPPLGGRTPPGPPEGLPIGRVALHLAEEGIEVVFATAVREGRVTGTVAESRGWRSVDDVAVAAAYDRYHSQKDPEGYRRVREALGEVPIANPHSLVLLCRDKVHAQQRLEAAGVAMPALETDPDRFDHSLARWGSAFVKPRYGAFGRGIEHLRAGDPVPRQREGMLPGVAEPTVLQRAISPPARWAGISVRVLVQRDPDGSWVVHPGVARRSAEDPVVNVSRGAEATPASDVLAPSTLEALDTAVRTAAHALAAEASGDLLAELGVDAVIDRGGRPWIIEVNSRPRGRLEALARAWPGRFGALHLEACARPLRFLAARAR